MTFSLRLKDIQREETEGTQARMGDLQRPESRECRCEHSLLPPILPSARVPQFQREEKEGQVGGEEAAGQTLPRAAGSRE